MEGGKGAGKHPERINAQFSAMPATECIGAGRLEGWFATDAFKAESRGWGHIQSYCFEGDLFFHLQRSPWLRGINFQRKDEVTFEVIEVNGRCEAVKLLLPNQVQEVEDKKAGEATDPTQPSPRDVVGQRVQGSTKSHYLLVAKQNWGFVASDQFSGQVFWHTTENPDMADVEFDRDDAVEFDVCLDEQRGGQVRAKNMRFVARNSNPVIRAPEESDSKRKKKEQWLKNWSTTPPPDWVCKFCGWQNFGRNKTCNFNNKNNQNCPGHRPPREEWPDVTNVKASEVSQDDGLAQKALNRQWQARQAWGKEEEVPTGWHSQADSQAEASGGWDEAAVKKTPIPVPVLDQDPSLLEAGLPGAIAAKQLKERLAQQNVQDTMNAQLAQQYGQQYQQEHYQQPQQQEHHQPRQVPPPAYLQPAGYQAPALGGSASEPAVGNLQAILALCLGAFNDLTLSQDPISLSSNKITMLVAEVNTVLGDDRSAKHTFSMQLAKHPWIVQNGFEVRYQPGKNQITISTDAAGQQQWGPPVAAVGVKRKAEEAWCPTQS